MSSYTPKSTIGPAFSSDGKILVYFSGYENATTNIHSTQAFSLNLLVDWTVDAPAFNKIPDIPPGNGALCVITPDGTIVLFENNTAFTFNGFWSSTMNINLGSAQIAANSTIGLKSIVNQATSDILVPAGSPSGNDMVVISLAAKTSTQVPMFAANVAPGYAADWNQALNGMVLLDITGELQIYSTASQWSLPIASGTIPSPRNSACFVAAGNEMILFGGYSRESGSSLNDLYVLDTATMTWRAGTSSSIANSRSKAACAYASGYLIILGGVNSGKSVDVISTSKPLLYHIKSNKWVTSYIATQVPTSQPNPTNTSPSSSNPTNNPSPSNGGNNIATIAGVVVGLVVLLALGSLIFIRRRRRRSVSGGIKLNSESSLRLQTLPSAVAQNPHSSNHEVSPGYGNGNWSTTTSSQSQGNIAPSQSNVSGGAAVSYRSPQVYNSSLDNGFSSPVSDSRSPHHVIRC